MATTPAPPTITLLPAQLAAVANYLLANPKLAHCYGLVPAELGAPIPGRPETFTYHLGPEPTPNRGYDDRLTMRLGLSRTKLSQEITLYEQFNGQRGGLRSITSGNKRLVSEPACREYLGDK